MQNEELVKTAPPYVTSPSISSISSPIHSHFHGQLPMKIRPHSNSSSVDNLLCQQALMVIIIKTFYSRRGIFLIKLLSGKASFAFYIKHLVFNFHLFNVLFMCGNINFVVFPLSVSKLLWTGCTIIVSYLTYREHRARIKVRER